MPSVDAWTGNAFPLGAWLDDVDHGVDTAIVIADKSTSITVERGATTLDAQTVRIEDLGTRGRQVLSPGGVVSQADVLVLGYAGHPAIADTDLQAGDRFAVAGVRYEVILVAPGHNNSLHAYARVRA